MATPIVPLIQSGQIAQALNQTIFGATSLRGDTEVQRAVITMTSDLRRIVAPKTSNLLGRDPYTRAEVFSLAPQGSVRPSAVSVFSSAPILANLRDGSSAYVPENNSLAALDQIRNSKTVEDHTGQMLNASKYIAMQVNPHTISFNQPKRRTQQNTQRGTVFHFWADENGQSNDILTISFQGNTGNISGRGATPEQQTASLKRFTVFHNFWQLTREPEYLTDGSFNTMSVVYQSQVFTQPIEFRGHWNKVLTFSDTGKKPNSRDYSAEFTVHETFPDLNIITSWLLTNFVQTPTTAQAASSNVLVEE